MKDSINEIEKLDAGGMLDYIVELGTNLRTAQKKLHGTSPKSGKHKVYLTRVIALQRAFDDSLAKIISVRSTPAGLAQSSIDALKNIVEKGKAAKAEPAISEPSVLEIAMKAHDQIKRFTGGCDTERKVSPFEAAIKAEAEKIQLGQVGCPGQVCDCGHPYTAGHCSYLGKIQLGGDLPETSEVDFDCSNHKPGEPCPADPCCQDQIIDNGAEFAVAEICSECKRREALPNYRLCSSCLPL